MNETDYFTNFMKVIEDSFNSNRSRLRLKSSDPVGHMILDKQETLILNFIEKTFDISTYDPGLVGCTLYEVIVGYGEGRADADLLAEFLFKDDKEYYPTIAADKDYYINVFKELIFY